jgi:hypothetical protein
VTNAESKRRVNMDLFQQEINKATMELPFEWDTISDNFAVLSLGMPAEHQAELHNLHCKLNSGNATVVEAVNKDIAEGRVMLWWPQPKELLSVYNFVIRCIFNKYLGDMDDVQTYMKRQFEWRTTAPGYKPTV